MAVKTFYFFGSYNAFRPFILTVNSGADSQFTIPTTGSGYNYSVKTSDGQVFTGVTGNKLINFPLANTDYDIEITGLFPQMYINNNSERLKVKDIKQWGSVVLGASQFLSYYNASNMTCTALDSPDMTLVTDGSGMFTECTSFNPPNFAPTLANLTNGVYMFAGCTSFNPPNFAPTLASLTNGAGMFYLATSFNPPNFSPTLDNLTNGSGMFQQATAFSQEIYAPNSIYLVDDVQMFDGTKIAKITMNNTALTTSDSDTFNCPQLTDLILTDRKVDLYIAYSPLLLGAKIDALANSVADMTGFASPNVTMTLAQRASCNQALWTNKNWTIIAI